MHNLGLKAEVGIHNAGGVGMRKTSFFRIPEKVFFFCGQQIAFIKFKYYCDLL